MSQQQMSAKKQQGILRIAQIFEAKLTPARTADTVFQLQGHTPSHRAENRRRRAGVGRAQVSATSLFRFTRQLAKRLFTDTGPLNTSYTMEAPPLHWPINLPSPPTHRPSPPDFPRLLHHAGVFVRADMCQNLQHPVPASISRGDRLAKAHAMKPHDSGYTLRREMWLTRMI